MKLVYLVVKNTITSIFGGIILAATGVNTYRGMSQGESVDTGMLVTQISIGLALLFARDINKSSKSTGLE